MSDRSGEAKSDGDRDDAEEQFVADTRFFSYARHYIIDLLNATRPKSNACDEAKRGILKIGQLHLYKVCISGQVVKVYDGEKFFRLLVDDSTGCMSVTLWKSLVYDVAANGRCQTATATERSKRDREDVGLERLLDSIRARVNEPAVNACVMQKPEPGDVVCIRGQLKFYRDKLELSCDSCRRVSSSQQELIHMTLPHYLEARAYSMKPTNEQTYETLVVARQLTDERGLANVQANRLAESSSLCNMSEDSRTALLQLVNQRLIAVSRSKDDSDDEFAFLVDRQSCSSQALLTDIRKEQQSCSNGEFKFVTHKQVLDALKELECQGLVYSCEDEFHYLPLI
jgi:hypothetical protein